MTRIAIAALALLLACGPADSTRTTTGAPVTGSGAVTDLGVRGEVVVVRDSAAICYLLLGPQGRGGISCIPSHRPTP